MKQCSHECHIWISRKIKTSYNNSLYATKIIRYKYGLLGTCKRTRVRATRALEAAAGPACSHSSHSQPLTSPLPLGDPHTAAAATHLSRLPRAPRHGARVGPDTNQAPPPSLFHPPKHRHASRPSQIQLRFAPPAGRRPRPTRVEPNASRITVIRSQSHASLPSPPASDRHAQSPIR